MPARPLNCTAEGVGDWVVGELKYPPGGDRARVAREAAALAREFAASDEAAGLNPKSRAYRKRMHGYVKANLGKRRPEGVGAAEPVGFIFGILGSVIINWIISAVVRMMLNWILREPAAVGEMRSARG